MPLPDAVPLVALSTAFVVVVCLGLLAGTVALLRSGSAHPWSAILVATLTCALCFTAASEAPADSDGPSTATVLGAVVGTMSLAAMVLALVPRSADGPPSRLPMLIAVTAIVIGALGLLVNELVG